jgi:hypothetical protein
MHQPSFPNLRLICAGTGYNLRAPDLFGLWLSLARAPRSGRGGRGFESHQPDHLASSRRGTDSPQRHRGHEGVHEEGVVIKKMATHTKPPRVDLRRLNLCDLCVLLCGPLFRPMVRDFAQKIAKPRKWSQAATKPSFNSAPVLSQKFRRCLIPSSYCVLLSMSTPIQMRFLLCVLCASVVKSVPPNLWQVLLPRSSFAFQGFQTG